MDPQVLDRFERLLLQWAGQWFPESRRGELSRALGRAAERTGWGADVAGFVEALEKGADPPLRDLVVGEVLVNETYFFRDSSLWEGVEKAILPDLLQRRGPTRNLRAWSAGCSTGEEPYSLALLLRAWLPRPDDWSIHLLATDLSVRALERAQTGVYGKRAFRELDRARWGSFFEPSGAAVRLAEPVRKMVHFRRHNLASSDFPGPLTNRMDLILCRNVLIYLERDLVDQVIRRFHQCLRPSGWLVLAPTEVPLEPPEGLRLVHLPGGALVLRRLPADAPAARPAAASPPPRFAPSPSQKAAEPPPIRRVPEPPPPPPLRPPPGAALVTPSDADLLAEAREAADRGDLTRALTRAADCVGRSPVEPAGWLVLAVVQEEMKLLDDAAESLRRALYLDPDLAQGHLQMARVQMARGDSGVLRSLANFRKLVEGRAASEALPDGGGMTVGEARHLADAMERAWARIGAGT